VTIRSIALALLAACGAGAEGPEQLTTAVTNAPTEIRADCALAAVRCSHCHTLDRVVNAPAGEPAFWQEHVHRMRLYPSSDIRPDEEAPIVRCLVYRSFGPDGLAAPAVAQ
jgi:hypothetical protein